MRYLLLALALFFLISHRAEAYHQVAVSSVTFEGQVYTSDQFNTKEISYASKVDNMTTTPMSFADAGTWIDLVNTQISLCGGSVSFQNVTTLNFVPLLNNLLKLGCP